MDIRTGDEAATLVGVESIADDAGSSLSGEDLLDLAESYGFLIDLEFDGTKIALIDRLGTGERDEVSVAVCIYPDVRSAIDHIRESVGLDPDND